MIRAPALFLGAALLSPAAAHAETLTLGPGNAMVQLSGHAFLLPVSGQFHRLAGTLATAPDGACSVALNVAVDSLSMSMPLLAGILLGADMLDPARFPLLRFAGTCAADTVEGQLDMHGEAHPIRLDLLRAGGVMRASATIRLVDWGITARPAISASPVRITVTIRP